MFFSFFFFFSSRRRHTRFSRDWSSDVCSSDLTGASRGIGAATARALGKAGAHVVAVARTVGGLEELDDAIRSAGGSATLVPLDVTDFAGLARLAGTLSERYGRLDILVGNAAIAGPSSPLDHIPIKDWEEVMKVNVTAN